MKYLEIGSLEQITSALNFEGPDSRVFGRVEAYSCKSAANDKKLFKALESKYGSVGAVSPAFSSPPFIPPQEHTHLSTTSSLTQHPPSSSPLSALARSSSPFAPLAHPSSKKAFFYLIATLNASFPDYEFSESKPSTCFRHHYQLSPVVNSINTTLINVGRGGVVRELCLWDVIDQLVELGDCEIYSYEPDGDEDPYEGSIWSLNYFFYNRKLKRIIFLSLHSVRINANATNLTSSGELDPRSSSIPSDDEDIIDDYEDYINAEMEF